MVATQDAQTFQSHFFFPLPPFHFSRDYLACCCSWVTHLFCQVRNIVSCYVWPVGRHTATWRASGLIAGLTTVQHKGQNHQKRASASSRKRIRSAMARIVPSDCNEKRKGEFDERSLNETQGTCSCYSHIHKHVPGMLCLGFF